MLYSVKPDYFFHQSYSRAERLKYRALKEELQFRKDQGEKDLLIKKRNHNSEEAPSQEFTLAHTRYDDRKTKRTSCHDDPFSKLLLILP